MFLKCSFSIYETQEKSALPRVDFHLKFNIIYLLIQIEVSISLEIPVTEL